MRRKGRMYRPGAGTVATVICDVVPMEAEQGSLRLRYWLHRDLASTGRAGLVFVMLNPSTADAMDDDPTVRRCAGFGRQWGYREMTVVNLFALRATKPRDLRRYGSEAAIGERNDEVLRWVRRHPRTSVVVAAWGNHGMYLNRAAAVMAIIAPAMTLGVTKQGCPKHPLYLPRSTKAVAYEPSAIGGRSSGAPPGEPRRGLARASSSASSAYHAFDADTPNRRGAPSCVKPRAV